MSGPSRFGGFIPYLVYRDADAAATWLTATFGFTEKTRWHGDAGQLTNIELTAGRDEIWLDHDPARGEVSVPWLGVWVDDVTAMRATILAAGVACAAPRDRPHGVREIGVLDPEGYSWGFLQRLTQPKDHT